jgi:hypothetical protein
MRIVDRKTFLALPAGTVYAKFGKQPKDGSYVNLSNGDIAIKGDTVHADFLVQEIAIPWFEGADSSDDHFGVLDGMLKGQKSPPLDYDCEGRDGLFDEDQLFAVWEREDLTRLISRLQVALRDGYGEAK